MPNKKQFDQTTRASWSLRVGIDKIQVSANLQICIRKCSDLSDNQLKENLNTIHGNSVNLLYVQTGNCWLPICFYIVESLIMWRGILGLGFQVRPLKNR